MLDLGHNVFGDFLVTICYKQHENVQKRRNENVTFKVGDLVMYQRRFGKKNLSQKLQTIWRGLYLVFTTVPQTAVVRVDRTEPPRFGSCLGEP